MYLVWLYAFYIYYNISGESLIIILCIISPLDDMNLLGCYEGHLSHKTNVTVKIDLDSGDYPYWYFSANMLQRCLTACERFKYVGIVSKFLSTEDPSSHFDFNNRSRNFEYCEKTSIEA